MNESSESTRKKLELLDQRIHEKTIFALSFLNAMTKNLNSLEKEGTLSPKIIARQRKQISKVKKSIMKIMTEGESRHIFQTKYR